jgi:zearalenone synthase (highly reducing iterative type I polyketide synthase)
LTGHSSGEIAAAYALGALSREDSLKVAYWRGKLSALIPIIEPTLKGAMLAVGASERRANEWISEVTKGQVNVACVNSGSSVTISGDVAGIQELQSLLQKQGVSERRLKVDTAYHSHHMVTIASQYLEVIKDVQVVIPDNGRRMYSSVAGGFVEASELGPAYWVRNLVSTVLFLDSTLELLRPTHSDQFGPGNAVDVVVEIGPHGALQGPIKDILKENVITGIEYQSVISRGKNSVNTALAFAGALFSHGVQMDIIKVNGDSDEFLEGMHSLQPLVSLPSYSFNHARTFWNESRINREYRMREHPHKSLIGAPLPHYGEWERLWRGHLRTSEESWIRDHKIQSSILFPAAGFIAMAIEGAFQLADKSRRICKFRIRDIQISAAAVVTEDSDLEAVLQLRPHLAATKENSSTWLEFVISTASSGQDLRQNCCGLLLIEYIQGIAELPGIAHEWDYEMLSPIDQYTETESLCQDTEPTGKFYEHLKSLGLNYGPAFRNMTAIQSGKGKSCCIVEISDPGSTVIFPKTDRPHFIHPTTLDAMFHAAFAALNGKDGHLRAAMVPTFIEEVSVSADIPFKFGSRFRGCSAVKRTGFRDISANICMLSEQLDKAMVSITGFKCTEVSGSGNSEESIEKSDRKICSRVIWRPALELLSSNQIRSIIEHSPFQSILRLAQLISIMIHTKAGLSIYELAQTADPVASILFPAVTELETSEVFQYVLSTPKNTNSKELEEKLGKLKSRISIKYHDFETESEAQKSDLVIVSRATRDIKDVDKALSKIHSMLNSDAKLAFTVSKDAEVWQAALERTCFKYEKYSRADQDVLIIASAPADTNGSMDVQVVILECSNSSESSRVLAEKINVELQTLSIITKRATWGAHLPIEKGKQYISLLELDNPMLENIGENDFKLVKELILHTSSLLWIVNAAPASALITGIARVVRTENSGSSFRTLQATSSNLDPTLVVKACMIHTKDSEFREENGVLMISRIVEDLPMSKAVKSLFIDEHVQLPLSQALEPQKLTIREPGNLDTLCFEADHRETPDLGVDEVEIEVKATGLK